MLPALAWRTALDEDQLAAFGTAALPGGRVAQLAEQLAFNQ